MLSPLSGVGRCRFVFVHGVTDGLQECVHKILKLNIAEGQEKEAKFRVIRVIVFVYSWYHWYRCLSCFIVIVFCLFLIFLQSKHDDCSLDMSFPACLVSLRVMGVYPSTMG